MSRFARLREGFYAIIATLAAFPDQSGVFHNLYSLYRRWKIWLTRASEAADQAGYKHAF